MFLSSRSLATRVLIAICTAGLTFTSAKACPVTEGIPELSVVDEALVLDPFIEQPELWCVPPARADGTQPVQVDLVPAAGYDPDPFDGIPAPPGLRFTFDTSPGVISNGAPGWSQDIPTSIDLPDTELLDLRPFTRLRFRARVSGYRHAFFHPGFTVGRSIYNEASTYNNAPLDRLNPETQKPGKEWREIVLPLDIDQKLNPIDDARRQAFTEFTIHALVRGVLEDMHVAYVDVDDFRLDNGDTGQLGWEIPEDELRVPSAGFRTHHEKIAIGHRNLVDHEFQVIDLDQPSNPVVFTDKFLPVRNRTHTPPPDEPDQASVAMADFSKLIKPGRYQVRSGSAVSPEFHVGPQAYKDALDAVAEWVADMRCGVETRLHPACHVDDGQLDGTHESVRGGWHDAGDLRTYYFNSYRLPYHLLRTLQTGWEWQADLDIDGVPDEQHSALSLVEHGLKHSQKTHVGGQLLNKIADVPLTSNNYWSDGTEANSDDRLISNEPEVWLDPVDLAASVGAYAHIVFSRPHDYSTETETLVRDVLEIARNRFDHRSSCASTCTPEVTPWSDHECRTDYHGNIISLTGRAALQLHLGTAALAELEEGEEATDLATASENYLLHATDHANWVLSRQDKSFAEENTLPFKEEWVGDIGSINAFGLAENHLDVAEEFLSDIYMTLPFHDCTSTEQPAEPCDAAPADQTCSLDWRHALRLGADYWMKPVRESWAPYSLPNVVIGSGSDHHADVVTSAPWKETNDQLVVPSAGIYELAESAIALHSMARALEDIELDRLARRQVQWALGLNPSGTTYICDHIQDASPTQLYSFSQGVMPGAIAGYGIGNDGLPRERIGTEPNVRAGTLLVRAMAAVSQPAHYKLTINGSDGLPYANQPFRLWLKHDSGQSLVRTPSSDPAGLLDLPIDGGNQYELEAINDCVRVPLVAISGTSQERTINLGKIVKLHAVAPERVRANTSFNVQLNIEQLGLAAIAPGMEIRAKALGASLTGPASIPIGALEGRSSASQTWEFSADPDGDDNGFADDHPFVITFWIAGEAGEHPEAIIDVTGVVQVAALSSETLCNDRIDNDMDGFVDCDDSDCSDPDSNPETPPPWYCPEVDCSDGVDNDGNNGADCQDPDCWNAPECIESCCVDGIDNDMDGSIDCADPDCQFACIEIDCSDGLDSDADGLIDCLDPDCILVDIRCHELGNCDDTIDNDLDGLTDCADVDDCCFAENCRRLSGCDVNGPWGDVGDGGGFGG
ncbi:MAG: glycoside hydrolase family 9 protein [Acidobacteriota bacterium]